MGIIFTGAADFSGLLNSTERLAVSKVIQKAFIEVNEEGSEAAAATGNDNYAFYPFYKAQYSLFCKNNSIKCYRSVTIVLSLSKLFVI